MSWHAGVKTGIGWPVLAGVATLALGFGGFGAWAAMAPLKGAVIAPGKVVVAGRNKVVQHLEGGIVKEILVEEGDTVRAGDPLLALDATASQALLNRLSAQLRTLEAIEARSLAERSGAETIAWPEALLADASTPEMAEVLKDQEAEFEAKREKHQAERAMLEQQARAFHDEIAGHEAQRRETERQIALLGEEREALEKLLQNGLTTRTRVAELSRAEAELRGRAGQLAASIAQAKQAIAQTGEKMEALKRGRLEETSARLSEARLKRADIIEQMHAAQDVLERAVVEAPVSGTVINLAKHNPGAVVAPGQAVLEIVPNGAGFVVEARVPPQDIDEVRVGQAARLNFSALDARRTPAVPGEVIHVSADRLEDPRTGEIYYLARLRITSEPVSGYDPQSIGPGQPVEAFITTRERTFLSYLLGPIARMLRRSVRES